VVVVVGIARRAVRTLCIVVRHIAGDRGVLAALIALIVGVIRRARHIVVEGDRQRAIDSIVVIAVDCGEGQNRTRIVLCIGAVVGVQDVGQQRHRVLARGRVHCNREQIGASAAAAADRRGQRVGTRIPAVIDALGADRAARRVHACKRECARPVITEVGREGSHEHALVAQASTAVTRIGIEIGRSIRARIGAAKPVVIDRRNCIVRRRNRVLEQIDRHRRGRRITVTIGHRVREGHSALLARSGRVGEAAVGVEVQRASAAEIAILGKTRCAVRAANIVGRDIAHHGRIFGLLVEGIVHRIRNIVDHRNVERGVRLIAVTVGDGQAEAVNLVAGKIGNVVAEFIAVAVIGAVERHGQRTICARHRAAARHIGAIDNQRGDSVTAGADADHAGGDFAVRAAVRTFEGRIGRPVEAGFVHHIIALDEDFGRRIVEQVDRYRGGRAVPVAISDRIIERYRAFFAWSRRVGESAVAIVDQRACTGERSLDQRNGIERDAVSAFDIVGKHIDCYRSVLQILRGRIIECFRLVIEDGDHEIVRSNITIEIGYHDFE